MAVSYAVDGGAFVGPTQSVAGPSWSLPIAGTNVTLNFPANNYWFGPLQVVAGGVQVSTTGPSSSAGRLC